MVPKRIIDLSIAIEHDVPGDPEIMRPRITYSDHIVGAKEMQLFFPKIEPNQISGGLGWATEHISLTTHPGTHLDAPYHYHPIAGIETGYCHMEKLANLGAIGRPHGFQVCCFPAKIKGASAGWTRAVAIVDEN